MTFENESLTTLFDHWNDLLKTTPSEQEREQLKLIPLYTLNDKDYPQKRNEPDYFNHWIERLPAYYQRKAQLVMAIYDRLGAEIPLTRVVSEVLDDRPQLSYFLFVRHLQRFVLKDPMRLSSSASAGSSQWQPEWVNKLIQNGVSLEEIRALTQEVALKVVGDILAVTDGYGAYGDLPDNAPRPRIVATAIASGQSPRYLDGLHEHLEL